MFGLAALADRMDQVIMTQGKNALTADTVFRSSNPLPEKLLTVTKAQNENLNINSICHYGLQRQQYATGNGESG